MYIYRYIIKDKSTKGLGIGNNLSAVCLCFNYLDFLTV